MPNQRPPLWVPNADDPRVWPQDPRFNVQPWMMDWLDSCGDYPKEQGVDGLLQSLWDAFGSGETAVPDPVSGVPVINSYPSPDSVDSQTMADYLTKYTQLKSAFTALLTSDTTVHNEMDKYKGERQSAQDNLAALILELGVSAKTVPDASQVEMNHVLDYVNTNLTKAKSAQDTLIHDTGDKTKQPIDQNAGTLKDVQNQLTQIQQKEAEDQRTIASQGQTIKDLEAKLAAGQNGNTIFSPGQVPGQTPGSTPYTPQNWADPNLFGNTANQSQNTGDPNSPLGNPNSPTGTGTDNSQLIDAIKNLGGSANTPSSVTPAADTSSMMNPLMSELPMLMSSMNPLGRDQLGQYPMNQLDPQRYNQIPQQVAAPPAATTPAAPATTQAAPSSTPATPPPSQAVSTQPPAPAGPAPDADGSFDYVFPDGKTQKVSAIVKQALDAAFGDSSATNAQAAYGKTTAKWSDAKHIGAATDPSQLITGDVATWQPADGTGGSDSGKSAIVRVTGSGTDATLDVIVNGKLVPFDQVPPDFGTFDGFRHPAGIEVHAGSDQSAGGIAVAGDPSVAAPATA